jgi:hypothetical protein
MGDVPVLVDDLLGERSRRPSLCGLGVQFKVRAESAASSSALTLLRAALRGTGVPVVGFFTRGDGESTPKRYDNQIESGMRWSA